MDGSEITRFLQAGATSLVLQSQDDVALHVKGYRRMRADLVFDAADARRDLGYAPLRFEPGPGMFSGTGELPQELPAGANR